MKKFLNSPLWRAIALTGLALCVTVLTLVLSATAYPALHGGNLFRSYFQANPRVFLINALLPVGLMWLGYFLTRRAWLGYLVGTVPCLLICVVNYFKIRLRSDPLLASDLLLAAEAGGIVGGYSLEISPVMALCFGCALAGLVFAFFAIPKGRLNWPERAFGLLSAAALLLVAMVSIFLSNSYEKKMVNNSCINQWSDVEVFVSRGTLYSFLHSAREMFPEPPEGYDPAIARAVLDGVTDSDIPEERKVSVMGIMLEAFCDLTDYPALAAEPGVMELYAPWHELEEQSIHGDLLTNIFAGGTVDSEWGFLTGYSRHEDFRSPTDSYVWYLKDQGYQTFGSHPGHGWFYNRQNVNQYLGFEEYRFTENYYGSLVDPTAAIWNSDHILMEELLTELEEKAANGPCFSFSVSYQNHGPYESTYDPEVAYVTGLDDTSRYIFNHYLTGVNKTVHAITNLVEGLEEMEEPVVLVLFGDHKPWAGNGNSAYIGAGVSFDVSCLEGFYNYYSTPYLIWANPAAREVLGHDFTGEGGDFSPCFLMTELFDQCGWEGPGVMKLARAVREISPLLHVQGLYLDDGALVGSLEAEEKAELDAFLYAQYLREHSGR